MKAPPPKRVHPRDSESVEQKSPADWHIDIQLVPFGIHWSRNAVAEIERVEDGRRVSMERAEKADQQRFLEAVLKFKWLSPQLRRAVMGELGLSLREQKREINEAIVTTLRVLIEERKAIMRKQGKRPRGGIHAAAIEQVATSQGISVDALEKRLERYPDRERRNPKKMARRAISEN